LGYMGVAEVSVEDVAKAAVKGMVDGIRDSRADPEGDRHLWAVRAAHRRSVSTTSPREQMWCTSIVQYCIPVISRSRWRNLMQRSRPRIAGNPVFSQTASCEPGGVAVKKRLPRGSHRVKEGDDCAFGVGLWRGGHPGLLSGVEDDGQAGR
jgi:hypothetical protein